MADKVYIQVRISENVEFAKGDVRKYNDALYYTEEEYKSITQEDINAEKQKRINNWKNIVQNPPAPVELSKEQYEAELARKEEEITLLKAKMTEKGYITEDIKETPLEK